MEVKFSSLKKDDRNNIKSILNGNGYKTNNAKYYKDGNNIILEIKSTGEFIKVNFN